LFSPKTSSRERRKEAARELLVRFDLDALARWAEEEPQAPRVLQHLLFDADELVAWRAVEGMGRVAAAVARRGLEPVRELVRRTLWLMNDESGGLLWNGPQVMGAVLANVPALRGELASVLASFLEEEPFRAGTRWALWRLSLAAPEALRDVVADLGPSLADPDPAVRGHAALALRGMGGAVPDLEQDRAAFLLFDPRTGELRETTVARAAAGQP
jgi:HEAT repeat protein